MDPTRTGHSRGVLGRLLEDWAAAFAAEGRSTGLDVSIIIRALDEAEHLPALLAAIAAQDYPDGHVEAILVDSGSTDHTVRIAAAHGARIVHIGKNEFSFGRSLNLGCAAASGEALVFISGHCIPVSNGWLGRLIAPLASPGILYSYGRQMGVRASRFSESRIFSKHFPPISQIPQDGFFCSNANAALLRSAWESAPFDEDLTGLEDMDLGKRLVGQGGAIAYAADAAVHHIHNESWRQVGLRFEREALALQKVMPEIQLSLVDFVRYFTSALLLDSAAAIRQCRFPVKEIILYRFMQYRGAYRGNHLRRTLSRAMKEAYFYPR